MIYFYSLNCLVKTLAQCTAPKYIKKTWTKLKGILSFWITMMHNPLLSLIYINVLFFVNKYFYWSITTTTLYHFQVHSIFNISIYYKMIITMSLNMIYHYTKLLKYYWLYSPCWTSFLWFIYSVTQSLFLLTCLTYFNHRYREQTDDCQREGVCLFLLLFPLLEGTDHC